jgi:hypothetical protein
MDGHYLRGASGYGKLTNREYLPCIGVEYKPN